MEISLELVTAILENVSYFTQFSTFTYIKIGAFDDFSHKLPRYLDDKMIMIELCRQIVEVNKRCT